MEVTEIKTTFEYKGKTIDAIPGLSEKEMLKIAANQYPELVNGTVAYSGIVDGAKKFVFSAVTGTKG